MSREQDQKLVDAYERVIKGETDDSLNEGVGGRMGGKTYKKSFKDFDKARDEVEWKWDTAKKWIATEQLEKGQKQLITKMQDKIDDALNRLSVDSKNLAGALNKYLGG